MGGLEMMAGIERKNITLAALTAILFFRLIIWKLLPGLDLFLKEDGINIFFSSLILLTAVVFGIVKLLRKETFSRNGFEGPLVLMSGALALSLLYTADTAVTLRSGVAFLAGVSLFMVLVDCLDSLERRKFFLWSMVLCAVLTAGFAIRDFMLLSAIPTSKAMAEQRSDLQYLLLNRRATSFIGWPNSLAGYLLLSFPFVGLGVLFSKGWERRVFAVMGIVMTLGLFVTFSFLGWSSLVLASLLMVPFLMTFLFRPLNRRTKMIMTMALALLGVLFLIVIVRKNFTIAMTPRKIYYEHSLKLIAQKPFLGHGFGTYGVVSRPLITTQEGITSYPHNTYLQWWLETGLFGYVGILWLLFIFTAFFRRVLARGLEDAEAWIAIALGWGLTAFFIDNFFSFTFIKSNTAVHGWSFLALFTAYALAKKKEPGTPHKQTFRQMWMSVGMMFVLLIVSCDLCLGFFWYYKGGLALRAHDLDGAGKSFVQGSLFDRWSAAYPVAAGNLAVAVYRVSRKEHHLRLAKLNFLEAVRREPLLFANHYMLSDIYKHLGDREAAREHARLASTLSPFEYQNSVWRGQIKKQ